MRPRLVPLALACLIAPAAAPADEPKPVPVGAKVENLRFKDIRYLTRSLDDFPDRKAFAVVFVDTGCPLVKRYFPTLSKLEKQYRDKGVQFLAVNASAGDTIQEMAQQAVDHRVEFPFVRDRGARCASALGVERTPEVVVLDAQRVIRYRGRIDDQYVPGNTRREPTRDDLREALDAVLAGKKVEKPTTTVDGCLIDQAPAAGAPVTFAEHVAPIIYNHCSECHRPGTAAPFPLLSFADVSRKGRRIAETVADGQMPPWYASSAHVKPFVNHRRLSAAERDTIARWVATGMARGDAAKEPRPPELPPRDPDGWVIGKPDLILETDEHELPADGVIDYRFVVLPHVFLGETWVEAVQILPDNPRVVHHANLAYGSPTHFIRESNFITGLVPGTEAALLPKGHAFRLPMASALGLQIHYVTTGKPEKCKIRVGLRYARGKVHKQMRFVMMDSIKMQIPAHAPHHSISLSQPLPCDAEGVALFAHMHLRGKAMVFRAHPPGKGNAQTLLSIPNYSFDWQQNYLYGPDKVTLPKGTRIECEAIFDNSAFNPFNPNPNSVVKYGRQTHDEMINGFFFFVDRHEDLNLTVDSKTGRVKRNADADGPRQGRPSRPTLRWPF